MATDIQAVLALLIEERAKVAERLALVDRDAENLRLNNAEQVWREADRVFRRASRRQEELINEPERRLIELDKKIELLTP